MPYNKVLISLKQLVFTFAAKVVLNLLNRELSTKALTHLSWKPLSVRRKIHRCTFVFRAIQSDKEQNPFMFPNVQGQDYHQYNTKNRLKFRLSPCKTNWGKNRSSYYFLNDFNK